MNWFFTFFRREISRFFSSRSVPPPSAAQAQKIVSEKPPDPYPGRDLVFTLLRDHLLMQHQQADQLDLKASGVLVGGTTLVGFAFLAQHHPAGNCSSLFPLWLHHWPLAARLGLPYTPFLLGYIVSVLFALLALRISGYWAVPDPVFALKNIDKTEATLKYSLSQAIAHFSGLNQEVLERKAKKIQWASRFLLIETIALVLLLLYQTIC